LEEKNKPYKVW